MNRKQMIGVATSVLALCEMDDFDPEHTEEPCAACTRNQERAEAVVDAILPQVTTVAELEALPVGTKLIGSEGGVWIRDLRSFYRPADEVVNNLTTNEGEKRWPAAYVIKEYAPLTVVWQP